MRIIHVFRSPVGGLFRHVRDLAARQAAAGHEVGIICDSLTGGAAAAEALASLVPELSLGITRLPMPRLPGPADIATLRRISRLLAGHAPDIVHGHGAKGGLHARLAKGAARALYTPHGGSLHYSWNSPGGAAFLLGERALLRRTDGLIFVCRFERDAFTARIGRGHCPRTVVHNGLREEEFAPVAADADASDFLFIGELRMLKGVDILLRALARLHRAGERATATIVGDGPDAGRFRALAAELGLRDAVSFVGAMPARQAFARGRIMVVPSRAESFPYVVLEAQGAALPVIASDVGGISEMLPPAALVPPEAPPALAAAMSARLGDEDAARREALARMKELKEKFSASAMAQAITAFYTSLA